MNYSKEEIMQYIREEDVKFIRLAFCDLFGRQRNVSVMPEEMERVFSCGVAIDASAIEGFGCGVHSDLFLHPDTSTISVLPWRPEHGRVVRMFCDIAYPDGRPFEGDARLILKNAVEYAKKRGYEFYFGSEIEFYLFKTDENGNPTGQPYDYAGYMDIAPEDKGENVRREICLTLERMGIRPESSHHEEGPGQNEITFKYSDPLTAADNAITFGMVVRTVAARNGLYADFSAKPISDKPGNGFHINISVSHGKDKDLLPYVIGGIAKNVCAMTAFFNPSENSYRRFGKFKAPKYVSWSSENRSQLIRIPATNDGIKRVELRSPDPSTNPYLSYALLIYAAIEGMEEKIMPPGAADINLYDAPESVTKNYESLPESREEAVQTAKNSKFIENHIPSLVMNAYLN